MIVLWCRFFRHQLLHFLETFDERMAPLEKLLTEKYGVTIKFAAVIAADHSSGHIAAADDAVDEKTAYIRAYIQAAVDDQIDREAKLYKSHR